jgi:hypothetical protein
VAIPIRHYAGCLKFQRPRGHKWFFPNGGQRHLRQAFFSLTLTTLVTQFRRLPYVKQALLTPGGGCAKPFFPKRSLPCPGPCPD